MSMQEMSKEERSVLQCQLGTMEERDNTRQVNISAKPNQNAETPTAQDAQLDLEPFEEVATGELDEAMMKNE